MTGNNGKITNECWKAIGIWGDRSCGELKTHTHCRNCPVYSSGGRNLLEREAPAEYVSEWTDLLAEIEAAANRQVATNAISIVIFRLGGEWLALPASLFKEVTPISPVRTLPHRSSAVLLGLVNVRGEIQMCISLNALLRLETTNASDSIGRGGSPGGTAPTASRQTANNVTYKRMVVVEKEGSRWVFAVDEMYGVHRIHPEEVRNAPATVSKVPETYIKGMIDWQDKSVSYLDDELLFYTLNKRVL